MAYLKFKYLVAASVLAAHTVCWAEEGFGLYAENEVAQTTAVTEPACGNACTESAPAAAVGGAAAESKGWYGSLKDNISQTWASEQYELYVPLRTWHNRSKYSKEKIKEFNEAPWGLGIAKYRDDEHGNTHSLAAMVFQDSHNDPEPTVAYLWQKNWRVSEHQKVAAGVMGGLTMRSDFNWVPIPFAWPYVGYSYRKLSVQGMYFPGRQGNGNIAFFWARYRF